jgi:hypothetical protein
MRNYKEYLIKVIIILIKEFFMVVNIIKSKSVRQRVCLMLKLFALLNVITRLKVASLLVMLILNKNYYKSFYNIYKKAKL